MRRSEGYGYEWDAMLIGGPADGCLDRTIVVNGNEPPETIKRIVDGDEMRRETLGEKLIEYLTSGIMDGNQRVAAYRLREVRDADDVCVYEYLETMSMDEFRRKYESSPSPPENPRSP